MLRWKKEILNRQVNEKHRASAARLEYLYGRQRISMNDPCQTVYDYFPNVHEPIRSKCNALVEVCRKIHATADAFIQLRCASYYLGEIVPNADDRYQEHADDIHANVLFESQMYESAYETLVTQIGMENAEILARAVASDVDG